MDLRALPARGLLGLSEIESQKLSSELQEAVRTAIEMTLPEGKSTE